MTRSLTRPLLWALGVVALLALLLVLVPTLTGAGSGTALGAPAAPPAVTDADLAGRWDMAVTIHSQDPPQHVALTCDLAANHHLTCDNKPGDPALHGQGVWNHVSGDAFGFWITHNAQVDADGNPTGSIYAEHLGTFSHDAFSTHGITFVDMHDGKPWMGPVQIEAVATRMADAP